LLLHADKGGTSLDRVQFIRPNLAGAHFHGAAHGIKTPVLAFVEERNGKRPFLIADEQNHDVRIH
jgi:hypothetical protein